MWFLQPKIQLSDELLIGSGGVRRVYQHPDTPDRCIKITYNREKARSVRREIRYLKKYSRQGKSFDHLVSFHGWCRTNLGVGAVFDLIRDYDGAISSSLWEHVAGSHANPLSADEILALLDTLKQHLLTQRIIVSDPAPRNLLVRYSRAEEPRLVVIDGIGNPHFIKLADYSSQHGRQLIEKKWTYHIRNNRDMARIFNRRQSDGTARLSDRHKPFKA